ncbi:lysylphosphatidylglycerol synthase transmembrane domain-containing protein [Marinobacter salicampi]|uniref:lysylphosphatidylglycerol synthase transmembrane domain-containing protein n=1 Tax=Marinobacter salicampi TaxID=435907 RepID=UPI00140DCC1B|nr:lysylphosphatidylglycerol synthase transmembrane domain-containing protein [Marinobacter salicampi]
MLKPAWQLALRWVLTLGLLGAVVVYLDTEALVVRLGQLSPGIVALALAITVVQVVVSAWRWRYTSARLGLELPLGPAIGEYYLATFLNQLLPGGVMGDVNRAWRHGRDSRKQVSAANAVLIERFSGQLVMAAVSAVLLVAWWPFSAGAVSETSVNSLEPGQGWLVFTVPAILIAGGLIGLIFRRPLIRYLYHLRADLTRSLLVWPVVAVQIGASLVVVGSYLAVFLLLAWGLAEPGTGFPWQTLLPLSAALLLAMALPVTVAGWGVREGMAAVLWPLAGLAPEQGVALSVAYGLLVLVSSLPGAVVLLKPGGVASAAPEVQVEERI